MHSRRFLAVACVLIAVGFGAALVLYQHARKNARMRETSRHARASQEAALTNTSRPARHEPRLKLPPPRLPTPAAAEAPPGAPPSTGMGTRVLADGAPKLTPTQLDAFLVEKRRSAQSLLTAYTVTRNAALLQEAAEKYPQDPQVNLAGWDAARRKKDSSSEERRKWLEAFKQAAPENALANFLSAQEYFTSGQTDRAVEELEAAAGKPVFQNYSRESLQNAEDLYFAAGFPLDQAKIAAAASLTLPELNQFKPFTENLLELAKLYRQGGDEASAEAALRIGLQLGGQVGESGYLMVQTASSLAMQRQCLRNMNPGTVLENGVTVQDRLNELDQRLALFKEVAGKTGGGAVLKNLSDQELASFFDRSKVYGEFEALRWAIDKQSAKTR